MPVNVLAHGIGVVRDLPIPAADFFVGAALVLGASFALLLALWRRPLLASHAGGRPLPESIGAVVLSRSVRVVLGALSVGLLALATALFGTTTELLNLAPTFVYVIFWLGIPLLSILFGNVWSVLSPWRALADAAVWTLETSGREARPVLEWTGQWGNFPAAGALFAVRRARARPSNARLPAHARHRGRALHVLGARRDGRVTFLNLGGLAFFVLAVLATYLAAVTAAEALGGIRRSLVSDFVLPLVPIAAAYLAAHYFTLS